MDEQLHSVNRMVYVRKKDQTIIAGFGGVSRKQVDPATLSRFVEEAVEILRAVDYYPTQPVKSRRSGRARKC